MSAPSSGQPELRVSLMVLKKGSNAVAHGPFQVSVGLHCTQLFGIVCVECIRRSVRPALYSFLHADLKLVCAVRNSAEPNETISGRNFVGDSDEFTKHFNNLPELSTHVADIESPVPAFDQHSVPCGVAASVRAKLSAV